MRGFSRSASTGGRNWSRSASGSLNDSVGRLRRSVRRHASWATSGRLCFLKACNARSRYATRGPTPAWNSSAVANANSLAGASTRGFLETTTLGRSCILADRSFHLQLDQAVHLDRVLHGQFLDQRLNEARNNHGGRFLLGQPARHQVEELLLADF